MTVDIKKGKAAGTVAAPPSKSMAHRSLICAALTNQSRVSGLEYSVDITATSECLKAMGAVLTKTENGVKIGGLDPRKIPECELYCFESGSTLRFLIPLCLLSNNKITLKGSRRLLERPLSIYAELCKEKELFFEQSTDGVTVKGPLCGGIYRVAGDVSSQFISGLLFALPLCQEDSEIEIIGKFESASYINLTIKSLADFGIEIERTKKGFKIKGGQSYKSADLSVEGDWSNAAFLDALTLLGGDTAVTGLDDKSLQGDRVYRDHFKALKQGFAKIDLSDCPDLAPILFSLAAALHGAEFTGTRRLKIKESDRAEAMRKELSKFKTKVTVEENRVIVIGGGLCAPNVPLYGHNDHRIVMSLAVLCTLTGGTIEGAEAVAKSFPDFFEKLKSLGVGMTINEA